MAIKVTKQITIDSLDTTNKSHRGPQAGTVTYGIHFLERNSDAYFSITGSWGKGNLQYGGADHDRIAALHPELKKWADIHLSGTDGVPLHSVENGWYFAGGTKWDQGSSKALAKHLRIPTGLAEQIVIDVSTGDFTKDDMAELVETLKPRWKAEAVVLLKELGIEPKGV